MHRQSSRRRNSHVRILLNVSQSHDAGNTEIREKLSKLLQWAHGRPGSAAYSLDGKLQSKFSLTMRILHIAWEG